MQIVLNYNNLGYEYCEYCELYLNVLWPAAASQSRAKVNCGRGTVSRSISLSAFASCRLS